MATVRIELSDDIAASLTAKAIAQGLTLEGWLGQLAAKEASSSEPVEDGSRKAQAFIAWAESFPDTPSLSDEAISRATLYPDRW
jgi:hypothetical protein